MSKLAVSIIESIDATTDLLIGSANTNTGNIRIFASNNTILFDGNPVFTGTLPVASDAFNQANTARNQANAAYSQANAAYTAANNAVTDYSPAFLQANTARDHANTAFAGANAALIQANTARDHANTAFAGANAALIQANTAYDQANAAFLAANTAPIAASQAEQEAATSTTTYVSPGRQHFHPSAAKFWAHFGTAGNLLAGYNITSITDNGAGVATVNIDIDFSSADYCAGVTIENLDATIDSITDGQISMIANANQLAGSIRVLCKNDDGTAATDPATWNVWGFGDLT